MHDFLLSNLIVRPKSLVCDLDSLSKILILLKQQLQQQQPKLLSIEKTLKFEARLPPGEVNLSKLSRINDVGI